jgi:hypothetical protein
MKLDASCDTAGLLNALRGEYSCSSPKAILSLMTDEDGDYFLRRCREEGGGIEEKVESFFKTRPVGRRIQFPELLETLTTVKEFPQFASADKSVVLPFTLHVWIGDEYIVHRPIDSKTRHRKMTIIDKLFHPVKSI